MRLWYDINKVRLCFLTQNYRNNQSKIQNNASSAFQGKMQKRKNCREKSASTIGKRLLAGQTQMVIVDQLLLIARFNTRIIKLKEVSVILNLRTWCFRSSRSTTYRIYFSLESECHSFVCKNYWPRKHKSIEVRNCGRPKETFLGRGR